MRAQKKGYADGESDEDEGTANVEALDEVLSECSLESGNAHSDRVGRSWEMKR
jgi:hypothetical protein